MEKRRERWRETERPTARETEAERGGERHSTLLTTWTFVTALQQEARAAMTGTLNVVHATDKPPSPAVAVFFD